MPTYEYRCDECDRNFDVVQSFEDDPLTRCPTCDAPVRKVFGSVGIVFKGAGFYKTDSRDSARRKDAPRTEGTDAKPGTSDFERQGVRPGLVAIWGRSRRWGPEEQPELRERATGRARLRPPRIPRSPDVHPSARVLSTGERGDIQSQECGKTADNSFTRRPPTLRMLRWIKRTSTVSWSCLTSSMALTST